MKTRYSISYFIILIALILTFVYAFAINNRIQVEEYAALDNTIIEESVNSNSDDVISQGYYLKELDGYIIVYLYDNETIFEYTDILISTLPEYLQLEVTEGKYIETSEELYAFLENYSS